MIEVFNHETVDKINSAIGRKVNISVFSDRVMIKIDWQSCFQIEKEPQNNSYVYHLYYIERGDKLHYGDYTSSNSLINSLIAKLKNIFKFSE